MSTQQSYTVRVTGCDDVTTVTIELTEPEAEAVRRLATLVTDASESICQPRMSVGLALDGSEP